MYCKRTGDDEFGAAARSDHNLYNHDDNRSDGRAIRSRALQLENQPMAAARAAVEQS